MLKDQLFKTSGLLFENWLFAPEKSSGLKAKAWRAMKTAAGY